MSSLDEYRILLRRAKWFLEEARDALGKKRYDLACFLAEQAAQLRIKAALYRLLGDYPRLHQVRLLLGELGRAAGGGCAREIADFIRRHRAELSELEDAYLMTRYSPKLYGPDDAEAMLRLVEKLWGLVERAEEECPGQAS